MRREFRGKTKFKLIRSIVVYWFCSTSAYVTYFAFLWYNSSTGHLRLIIIYYYQKIKQKRNFRLWIFYICIWYSNRLGAEKLQASTHTYARTKCFQDIEKFYFFILQWPWTHQAQFYFANFILSYFSCKCICAFS